MQYRFKLIQRVSWGLLIILLISCTSNKTPAPQLNSKLELSLETTTLTLNLGDSATLGLSIESENLTETIELSVSGLPDGVSVNSPDLSVAASESSLLIFDVSSFATTGESSVTISASSGEAADDKTLKLMISETPQAELSNLLPTELSLTAKTNSSSNANAQFDNTGNAPLTFNVSSEVDWLAFTPITGELAPGQSQSVLVTANCAAAIETKIGAIKLETSDSTRSIPVVLNCTAKAPETGQLVVAISGLPGSANANVEVNSESFSESLSESKTLADLSPGEYSVIASDVMVAETVYSPTPASQTVTITEGGTQVVTVAYEAQKPTTGSLSITVSGLPDGLGADASLSGPEGFSQTLSKSTELTDLSPGVYTLAAKEVGSEPSYVPNPESQTLTVSVGESTRAKVIYTEKEPGKATLSVTIEGLREGVDANIKLTKPDGFSTIITQNASYNVEPGTYLLEALPTTPDSATFEATPKNLNIELTENTTTVAVFSYECTQVSPVDINLDEALQEATDKTIYNCADLAKLEELYLPSKGLQDLEGLQYASNLEYLYLRDNEIADISKLANLNKLSQLALDLNKVTDLSPLENLSNLKGLNLQGNPVEDLSSLSTLVNLEILYTSGSQLSDLSALANLSKLKLLDMSNSNIEDISPLQSLTSLETLWLSSNQIKDIAPISQLINLEYLRLNYNEIGDISSLENLTNLSSLHLKNNLISDISPLVKNTGLGEGDILFLDENCISKYIIPTKGYLDELRSRNFREYSYKDNPKADCPPPSPVRFHYAFNNDAEGWLLNNFSGSDEITHHSNGGASGAYISMPNSAEMSRWFWQSPSYFTGDASAYYGAQLSFYLKNPIPSNGEALPIPEPFVIWEGDGDVVLIKLSHVSTEGDWAFYQVRLSEEAGWLRGLAGTSAATKEDILAALEDLDAFLISSDSKGHGSALDEVKLEPVIR